MFYVYLFQNLINYKIYIGKTNDPKMRLSNHLSIVKSGKSKGKRTFNLIHKAIAKYGFENFNFQILESFSTEKDCLEAEKFWIEFFRSDVNKFGNEYGYNLTAGGDGPSGRKHSLETKLKISIKNKGRRYFLSEEQKSSRVFNISNLKRGNIQFKIEWPSDEELISMLNSSSQRKVASLLGVTQKAISHRLKTRNLKYNKSKK